MSLTRHRSCSTIAKKMKYTLISLVALGIGVLIGKTAFKENEVHSHWALVNEYREWIENPGEGITQKESGLVMYDIPVDHTPSLHYLVSENEIRKAELIFPTIPYSPEIVRLWMQFCEENKEVLIDGYATPESSAFEISGEHPFNCVMFYLPENDHVIEKLVALIENGAIQSE